MEQDPEAVQQEASGSPLRPRPGPVRFKASSDRSKRRRTSIDGVDASDRTRRRRSKHRHHYNSSRHADSRSDRMPTGQVFEDDQQLDPDAAFRESLFDAMADDEGADFWQGVYGQPIHHYPNARQGPDGKLERMDDEEYVAYVRARMWEKSHEHIIEERLRREEDAREREARKKESARLRAEAARFDKAMEESLRRKEKGRVRRRKISAWERYEKDWGAFLAMTKGDAGHASKIPWPVRSGKLKDVSAKEVQLFMEDSQETSALYAARLKAERVRYHPDKVQQRVGMHNMSPNDVQAVTKVFQIMDDLYLKSKNS